MPFHRAGEKLHIFCVKATRNGKDQWGQVPLPLPQVFMTGWYAQMMRQGLESIASEEGEMFHCERAAVRPEISSRVAYWSSRSSGLQSNRMVTEV